MRFKYRITFGITILILILVGCGIEQLKKEAKSPNSQISDSINAEKPSSNSKTSIPSNSTSENSFTSIHMVDAMTGWASTKESILRTIDGGENWTDVTPKGITDQVTGAMFVRDAKTTWIIFTQEFSPKIYVYHTLDGGVNWAGSVINTSPNPPLATTLSFTDLTHGWLLAGYDVSMGSETDDMFQTNDGGISWKLTVKTDPDQEMSSRLPFSSVKTGLVFADHKNGWLTGFTHGDGIWLYTTTDEGLTWTPKNLAAPSGYHTDGGAVSTESPHFFEPKVGLLPVEFRGQIPPALVFYITQDGGISWNATTPVKSSQESYRGFQWSLIDTEHSIVSDGYKLYYTFDGSHTFVSIKPNIDLKSLQQLDFVTEQLGWAIIDGGLWKTSDGGHAWTEISWTKAS